MAVPPLSMPRAKACSKRRSASPESSASSVRSAEGVVLGADPGLGGQAELRQRAAPRGAFQGQTSFLEAQRRRSLLTQRDVARLEVGAFEPNLSAHGLGPSLGGLEDRGQHRRVARAPHPVAQEWRPARAPRLPRRGRARKLGARARVQVPRDSRATRRSEMRRWRHRWPRGSIPQRSPPGDRASGLPNPASP